MTTNTGDLSGGAYLNFTPEKDMQKRLIENDQNYIEGEDGYHLTEEDEDRLLIQTVKDVTAFRESFLQNEDDVGGKKPALLQIVSIPLNFIGNQFAAGSIKGSVFTLFSATIGAGILGLPYAIEQAGAILGISLIVCAAVLNYFTAQLLVLAGHESKQYRYFDLAIGYGKFMTMCVKWIFFLNNWGIVVGYTTLINILVAQSLSQLVGDQLPSYMTDVHSPFWAVVINVVFILPLTLQRNLSSLRYVCLVGFFFVCYVVVVIVTETFNPKICDYKKNFQLIEYANWSGIFNTWSISLFAFQCHQNVLDTYKELKTRNKKTMSKVMIYNNLICFISYSLVGFFGYLTFADQPQSLSNGNILQSDYKQTPAVMVSILSIGLQLIPATPLTAKPAKDGLLGILYPLEEKDSPTKHFILTCVIIFTQLITALFIPDMATVLTWVGGTTSGFINMTFPCLFYLKVFKDEKMTCRRLIVHILNIFSVVFCIATVTSFLINGTK